MKTAIQGIKGSFHHGAAKILIGSNELDLVCLDTFAKVFEAVSTGLASYGVSAIENNLHGSINAVYRLLENHKVWITKDIRMKIDQNLISKNSVQLASLNDGKDYRVLSHPVALAQVEHWLDMNLPDAKRIESSDTAASVLDVMTSSDPKTLAVAGDFAVQSYGAKIVASDIQDNPDNFTRFILFQKDRIFTTGATHGSVIVTTDHTPGSLLKVLKVFDSYGCNLTKLDSHPIASDRQHYRFYIDYELCDTNDDLINSLKVDGYRVKLLGLYTRMEA